jgi:hypothetical protein
MHCTKFHPKKGLLKKVMEINFTVTTVSLAIMSAMRLVLQVGLPLL